MANRRLVERLRARRRAADPTSEPPAPGAPPPRSPESQWFWDHYDLAAQQVVEAFAAEEISMTGRAVADVGCGDGIIDLGVLHKGRPRLLRGFDLNLTNAEYLRRRAAEEGVDASDREGLEFERSEAGRLPADNGAFDLVFSWSAFEHISRPIEVLREIRRVLAPQGAFFLQLWPFYFSAKGSHLWEWFPEDHHHLQRPESEVTAEVLASDVKPQDWTQMMAREFQHLNRITVDELQRSMLAAGFVVRRLELLTSPTRLTSQLARYSWLDLGVSGIKLIATPA
ncbi:MAG TPA: class I SAM-dependent methyltransferase [Solirubrobacteraceae bacterium]|nr:class I SAM-dependent methyltransferase [Solirubrobacteraceae bacterium]